MSKSFICGNALLEVNFFPFWKVFVSAGPSVINDKQTQEVVKGINLDFLLLETDAPVQVRLYGCARSRICFREVVLQLVETFSRPC